MGLPTEYYLYIGIIFGILVILWNLYMKSLDELYKAQKAQFGDIK